MDPLFQRAASRHFVSRSIARNRAARLFDLVAGFTYSQTLFAVVKLGLLDLVRDDPQPVEAIALRTDLAKDRAERLVRAAIALELLESSPRGIALGQTGAALLGNPGVLAMIRHHDLLYADLADPVALLRAGTGERLSRFWNYRDADAPAAAPFSELMAASQPAVAAELLDAYRFARHRRLLDVAGGEGAFLQAVGGRVPKLERGLFDLPAVAARAAERLAAGVAIHPGRLPVDPLPGGYDLITLVRVLHDHDDQAALAILRAVRAALPPGGRLLIGEPMAGDPATARMSDTYFGWYLLAMGQGHTRSPRDLGAMLIDAGFAKWRALRTNLPIVTSAIVASA